MGADAYRGLVTGFGVTVSATRQASDNQAVLTAQVDASRESVSGINIDEEMVNLLAAQRGYEGASRVLTTMDSMLDTLINRTGLVALMSAVRITQRLMVDRSLSSLQLGLGRLSTSQEKLSTGRVINRPSDSPTGTNDAMRLRADLAAERPVLPQRRRRRQLAQPRRLHAAVDARQVRRARDLIVQGASTGSTGADARDALAAELTQIRPGLIDQANTQHLGRPLFGGTTAGPRRTTPAARTSGTPTTSAGPSARASACR